MPIVMHVPPLNLQRRPRRKSLSMDAAQGSSIFEDKRTTNIIELTANAAGPSQLLRTQSLHHTQSNGKKRLPRLPRPLPPVPLSRPSSPVESEESSPLHGSRPLPLPPAGMEELEPALQSAPANLDTTPSRDQRAQTPPLSFSPSPAGFAVSPDDELPSPLSPTTPDSSFPNLSLASMRSTSTINTLLTTPTLGKKRSRRDGRVHASPYKWARGPARFSTTSLSSQISVPPMPPPAEVRRRNRDKMAKLIRKFGDCPPSHLVFGEQEDPDAIEEEIIAVPEPESELIPSPPKVSVERPPRRSDASSSSSATCIPDLVDEKIRSYSGADVDPLETKLARKALSDSDAGHSTFSSGKRDGPPISVHTKTTTRVLHRMKKGRADADKAARYVVSLAGDSTSPASARYTFKLTTKVKPCGSYLRSAYGLEMKKVEEEVPPLPVPLRFSALDLLNKQSKKWVHETDQNRWEVDDYNNVMESLRKL